MKDWFSNIKILYTIIFGLIAFIYWLKNDVDYLKVETARINNETNTIRDSFIYNQRQEIWKLQDSVHVLNMKIDRMLNLLQN